MAAEQQMIAIVLAAGQGKRLKSNLPKVLHALLGQTVVERVLNGLASVHNTGLKWDEVVVVLGHQADQVQTYIERLSLPFKVKFVLQTQQLGTGHAVQQVAKTLNYPESTRVLITCGDMPLLTPETYEGILSQHDVEDALSVLAVNTSDPDGYGRVFFDPETLGVTEIIEHKDASEKQRQNPWVNAGVYVANWAALCEQLDNLKNNNQQGEYYLTDVVGLLVQKNKRVKAYTECESDEMIGINSREDLAVASLLLTEKANQALLENGVSLVGESTIAPEVKIGKDTTILPNCYIVGAVEIGDNCTIGPNTTLVGPVKIGNHCQVLHSVLQNNVVIGNDNYIGPFAHLRDQAEVDAFCKVGNFVEVKQTRIGHHSNAAHLCYLGDAQIGSNVNMGAGSIIANYDPILDEKHETVIEDDVKVGCNSTLVSPVVLGEGSCVAAGSVITEDVSADDLAIARSKQSASKNWVSRKKSTTVLK